MRRDRLSWLEDDGELQVFVPGLMATGILVSIGMLIWDGVKRFLPDLGGRRHAARLSMHTAGRVSDLASIERGSAPAFGRVTRMRRARGSALLLAIASLTLTASSGFVILAAYQAKQGSLAGRGWTLTMGVSVATTLVFLAVAWLFAALGNENLPAWIERAQRHWPIGVLPEPPEDGA